MKIIKRRKGNMRISIKIEEVLGIIEKEIREKLKIDDSVKLVYTSNTTFLTFDVIE